MKGGKGAWPTWYKNVLRSGAGVEFVNEKLGGEGGEK